MTSLSGYSSAFESYFEERLAGALGNHRKFSLVDGFKVKEALKSLEKPAAENLDYADLKKVGESFEADSVLKGSILKINGMIAINWSLYRVSEGNIISAGTENAAINPFLSGLMNKVLDDPKQLEGSETGISVGPEVKAVSVVSPAPVPVYEPFRTPPAPIRPTVIDYDNQRVRLGVRENVPVSRRYTRVARTSTLSGYHIIEVQRAIIDQDTVTFAFTWTNLTNGTSRLLSSCLNRTGTQRPYILDKHGRKYYSNKFKLADPRQFLLYPNTPVHGTINFPGGFGKESGNDIVDLYIQLPGRVNPPQSIVFRSLRMAS